MVTTVRGHNSCSCTCPTGKSASELHIVKGVIWKIAYLRYDRGDVAALLCCCHQHVAASKRCAPQANAPNVHLSTQGALHAATPHRLMHTTRHMPLAHHTISSSYCEPLDAAIHMHVPLTIPGHFTVTWQNAQHDSPMDCYGLMRMGKQQHDSPMYCSELVCAP